MRTPYSEHKTSSGIVYRIYNEGRDQTLLFIQGAGLSLSFIPEKIVDTFVGRGYTVIVYDHRDVGLSVQTPLDRKTDFLIIGYAKYLLGLRNKIRVPYTIYGLADDALEVLLSAHIGGNVSLVGYSMGGMIAQILAARYPKMFVRVALISTTLNKSVFPMPKFKYVVRLAWLLVWARGMYERFEKSLRYSGFDDTDLYNWKQLIESARQRGDHVGTQKHFLAGLAVRPLIDKTSTISQPLLIIHGARDFFVRPFHARELHAVVPQSELLFINDMEHIINGTALKALATFFGNSTKGVVH